MNTIRTLAMALMPLFMATSVSAHYHILIPSSASAKTDEAVQFTYQFGHPFEHQLFDTARPAELYAIAPDGTRTDLLPKLEEVKADGADGKKVVGFKFAYTPTRRGAHTIVAVAPELKVEGEPLPLRDVAKVVLYVQTQNGWDRKVLGGKTTTIETTPLTRPFAIAAGSVFEIEADEPAEGERKALAGIVVEIERYNNTAPKDLPADEFITRTSRTNKAGSATITLPDAGWWAITTVRDHKDTRHRCTLWVQVTNQSGK